MANTHSISLTKASSQYLSVADTAPLSITGDLTIECWVKLSSAPSSGQEYAIIGKSTTAGNQVSYYFYYVNNGGTPAIEILVDSAGTLVTFDRLTVNYTLSTGVWYHVAVTWDTNGSSSSTATFYVNGSSIGTDTSSIFAIFNSTSPFAIGALGSSTNHWDGKIDDVRVWDTIRSGAQISANYQTEIDSASNLQGSWHLNNVLTDSSGNAATLTNNNSATFSTDIPVWTSFIPKMTII